MTLTIALYSIKPTPKYKLTEHIIDDKIIIELYVYKGKDTPYLYKNTAYMRADTASIPCDNFNLRKLILNGMNLRFEQLNYEEENLSFEILEKWLKLKLGIEKLSLDILKTLGLYKNNSYNIAGALIADKNVLGSCGIDMVRFGETENIFLDRKIVEKESIIKQYEKALKFFDKWYSPYEEISGFFREKRIYIPREAFREAIANALCHRDYSINAKVRVACYEDHIEIVSPGGLMEGLSEKEFLNGKVSSLRNEIIAEVFHRLDFIEKFATGIKRIKGEYKPFIETPKFEVLNNSITVILPRIDYDKNVTQSERENLQNDTKNNEEIEIATQNDNVNLQDVTLKSKKENNVTQSERANLQNDTLNNEEIEIATQNDNVNLQSVTLNKDKKLSAEERQKEILNLIKNEQDITAEKLAEIFKVHKRTIKRDLKVLTEKKLIRYEGSSKKGIWIVEENNKK